MCWLWRNYYRHGKESVLTPLTWELIQEHISGMIFHDSERSATSHSCSICLNRHLFSEWDYLVKMLCKQQKQLNLHQRFVARVLLHIAEHPQLENNQVHMVLFSLLNDVIKFFLKLGEFSRKQLGLRKMVINKMGLICKQLILETFVANLPVILQ